MSHTLQLDNFLNAFPLRLVKVTIGNYATGGELVTPAEIIATTVDAIFFATVPASQNSLAVSLFPLIDAGKIKLFQFVSGSPVEIPPTANLNAVVNALVHISQY